nr:DNA repair protein RecN [Gordonibacter sp. Marseille-P4307]
MIDEIQVSDLALIRSASLAPADGLTVLTGETGAGKSALLSAFKLLMGGRSDKAMVREGASSLQVEGRFFGISLAAGALGCDEGSSDGAELSDEAVVVRRVGADGRSRVFVNGSMASARQLADTVAAGIDLCGQFEHQQLMKPANHAGILDSWAGDEARERLEAYRVRLSAARGARLELDRVREAQKSSSERLDEARFVLKRIGEIDPQPGEYEQLVRDLSVAENAEALAISTATAHEALSADGGALDALNTAASALESCAKCDSNLGELAQQLRETGYVLEDIAAQARDYREGIDFDAQTLAFQQERIASLQGLMREFGPRMDDVLARRDRAADEVSLVDDAEMRESAAVREVERAEAALLEAADALDAARCAAAPEFEAEVNRVLGRLEMGSAALVCSIGRLDRAAWSSQGPSSVEFMYRPAAGMQVRPLARIASGGEVSRVMLATKVALGKRDTVDTLVFDEVDAGVGGSVANALAEVIADLAHTHQVIVVTHLAQVAVRAQRHYVVSKTEDRSGASTMIGEVSGEDRVAEIARMLSGGSTEASVAHAREMLRSALA